MIGFITNFSNVLPIIKIELYNKQSCLYFQNFMLYLILKILKYHFKYNYKLLTCLSTFDTENKNRFKLVFDILSLKLNNRIRIKIQTNEMIPVYSVTKLYSGSTWWEYECWDMFGVLFLKQKNSIRLLTDYGFQGFPLRKDFPLTGFVETKYHLLKNRVSYTNLELSQNFRIFN